MRRGSGVAMIQQGHMDGAVLMRTRVLLPVVLLVTVALVVPAWLRAADAERVVAGYSDPDVTHVIVTKLDETQQIGGALHAALPRRLPLAYLCNGPRVPEDITDASRDSVLSALFPSDA